MDRSVSGIMNINDKELKEILTDVKRLEEYGLYKKSDRNQIEYAIKQKQEKRHARLQEIIHEELIKKLDKEIELTKKQIARNQSELEKQQKARAHAGTRNYNVEISDYKGSFDSKPQWIVLVEIPKPKSIFPEYFREHLFIDKDEKD